MKMIFGKSSFINMNGTEEKKRFYNTVRVLKRIQQQCHTVRNKMENRQVELNH